MATRKPAKKTARPAVKRLLEILRTPDDRSK